MMTEWPLQQAQTKAAMKKVKPLEDKVLAEVRKKIKQTEKMIEPAVEKSRLAHNTTVEAERMAQDVAQVCAGLCLSSLIKAPF